MNDVRFSFKIQAKGQFFDRAAALQLDPVLNRYFRWTGAAVRRAARRSLKVNRKRVGQLSSRQRERWDDAREAYRDGRRRHKPMRPVVESKARPGEPPHLTFTPNPLRDTPTGILFTLAEDKDGVVVGPSPFGENGAEAIERRHPFMSPALEKIRPTMPAIFDRATLT